jgi:hypothetical protein
MPRVDQPMDMPDGVQGAAVGPVGVLLRLQVGLEDRLRDQYHGHLRHAVPDRTNPQGALLAIRFGDEHASHWLGSVRLGERPGGSRFGGATARDEGRSIDTRAAVSIHKWSPHGNIFR